MQKGVVWHGVVCGVVQCVVVWRGVVHNKPCTHQHTTPHTTPHHTRMVLAIANWDKLAPFGAFGAFGGVFGASRSNIVRPFRTTRNRKNMQFS